ncbi:hypothetical protein Aduo_012116 [Ancylostoma duodenale]
MKSEVLTDYEYRKVAYCNSCDVSLPNGTRGRCRNDTCRIEGLNPKRSKNMRPTTIHTVKIAPQLDLILNKHLDTLLKVHGDLHLDLLGTFREETSHFPQYKGDIESRVEFDNRKINVVLTISFDGVKLKKLTRCEAWPICLRMEGLTVREKNKPENIILAGVMFTSKNPNERLLDRLFSRLAQELVDLKVSGVTVKDDNGLEWTCYPTLRNAVMDFAALKDLYGLPRWQSSFGCHLCTTPGEKIGRRMCWYVSSQRAADRRTSETIIRDAEASQNGLEVKDR